MRFAATAAAAALAMACAGGLCFAGGPVAAQTMHQSLKDARKDSMSGGNVDRQIAPDDYIEKSAIGDMFEVDSSHLAIEKAQSPEVKQFAQKMVDDHSKALDDLKAAAGQADMAAKVPDRLDTRHQRMIAKLTQVSEDKFDDMYVKAQLRAHKEAVNLQKAYAHKGTVAPLQAHAQDAAPKVSQHLKEAQQLASAER